MGHIYSESIQNDLKEIPRFILQLNRFLDPYALTTKVINAVNLVLEEALLNIIKYGYDDGTVHSIAIHVDVNDDEVALRLEDDAKPFNPLTVPRPDKSKPAMERIEDGLGIHLVRSIMRSMSYSRKNGKNIFEIWIRR